MKGKKKISRWFGVNDKMFFDHLPFILFLTMIGFLYITNSYYVEDTVREIEHIKNKKRDQNNIFVLTKTQMSLEGQRNEVEEKVTALGLKESENPPYQISLKKTPN
jgi:hypothetical protein|tara:strand:+ start:162 stop:479 length:318 start_codon:yes stop_codon:yes gene_type:complete